MTGTGAADNEVLYLLVVVYSFYFLGTRHALFQLAFVGVAYGWLLLDKVPVDVGVARWMTTIGTLTIVGLLVRQLNVRVEGLIDELGANARHDPLTGALNRRGLDERLGIEVMRARRTGEPLTVVTADLDRLKAVNDEYGHAAGDEALHSVGLAGAPPLPLDPDTLLEAADRALYRAKALGRDRASVAGQAELSQALEHD